MMLAQLYRWELRDVTKKIFNSDHAVLEIARNYYLE